MTDDPHETVEALLGEWAQREMDLESVSLGDTVLATPAPPGEHATLPSLLEPVDGAAPIELGEVLGEGGMGVVLAAVQTSLGRTVAVKTLRADTTPDRHALQLLREGRVTGLLEHPNVVPVHAIGRDRAGRPLIVMKRIVGTPWADLLDEPTAERRSAAYLREHLGILERVAVALHFAHSQGILHRDIKPDNVMIGAFGEVYVVDWGIAVTFDQTRHPHVPRATDVTRIEGTPVYMAPEMVAGAGDELSVATDVYLLGATLHHVMTGTAPHEEGDLRAVLEHAFASAPIDYDPSLPGELVAIARRAMAAPPEERFPSAAAFSSAVRDFLVHGGSVELCEEGERRAEELARRAADASAAELDTLFHEARFAFDQALRSWPDNERATRGQRALLETMAALELSRSNPRGAQTLLRQHADPPAPLAAEVEAALERLEDLERDADASFGLRERVTRLVSASLGWAVVCFTFGHLTRSGVYPIDHQRFAIFGLATLCLSLVSVWRWRSTMLANATNRQWTFTSVLVFVLGAIAWPWLGSMGVSMPATTAVMAAVNGSLWLTLAPTIGWVWLPVPVAHFLAALGASIWPTYHFEIFGLIALPLVLVGVRMARHDHRARS